MTKKLVRSVFALFFILLFLLFIFYNESKSTFKEGDFIVKEGASIQTVFKDLANEGYLKNGEIAFYYSKILHPSSFKAGNYHIPANMSTEQIIDYLSNSDNIIENTVNITFIEGDWLKDMAKRLAEKTNLNADDLIAYWDNKENVKKFIDEYDFLNEDILDPDIRHPLEGYLAPNTYNFYTETTNEDVTRILLNQTAKIYNKYYSQFASSSYSIHEIFTLASIVQYEAGNIDDMEKVAAVFYNRLNDNMRLESSVTICYALDLEDKSDWTSCEYNPDYDSPYNTYKNDGLPPGPILNPGEDAIKAVLNPDQNSYYYFIGDVCGNGEVHYAETYAEHQQNVKEYLWCY